MAPLMSSLGLVTDFLLFLNNSTQTVNVSVEADYWYILKIAISLFFEELVEHQI